MPVDNRHDSCNDITVYHKIDISAGLLLQVFLLLHYRELHGFLLTSSDLYT